MVRIVSFLVLVGFLVIPAQGLAQESIKGRWYTDPDQALSAAKKAKKPVLAAVMDHA